MRVVVPIVSVVVPIVVVIVLVGLDRIQEGLDVVVLAADQSASEPAATAERPVWDWAAANQRKKDAVQQLAPLADALDDHDARIPALLARTRRLKLG